MYHSFFSFSLIINAFQSPVDGAEAGEDAGMAVGEVVADASEIFVEVEFIERFAVFVEVVGPECVEGVHVVHGEGCNAGVVD